MADYEVEVLVRGRPVKVFKHKGNHFVEGRNGSSFELKVTNNTWDRIEVVGSVDGLSVTDGEECGPESDGYIVPAKESIVIPGWKLPNDKAAEFVFEDKRKSYSNQVGKGTQNVGVIGLMVFTEKEEVKVNPVVIPQPYPQPYPVPTPNPYPNPWDRTPWNPTGPAWSGGCVETTQTSSPLRGQIIGVGASTNTNVAQNISVKGSGKLDILNENCDDDGDDYDICNSLELSSMDGAMIGTTANVVSESLAVDVNGVEPQSLFEIGTGWGDEVDHKVSMVEFERTDKFNPDKILSIYYDTKKGLISRGIEVVKTKKRKTTKLPNAFPTYKSTGCTPPPGWKK